MANYTNAAIIDGLHDETRLKIDQLQIAIQNIEDLRNTLDVNATDTQTAIQKHIQLHTNALRSRELLLLLQVDKLKQEKKEDLLAKRIILTRSLEMLTSCLDLPPQSNERTISSALDKLDDLISCLDGTADFKFKADSSALQENIQSFGTIELEDMKICTSNSLKYEEYPNIELFKTREQTIEENCKAQSLAQSRGSPDCSSESCCGKNIYFRNDEIDFSRWLLPHQSQIQDKLSYQSYETDESDSIVMIPNETGEMSDLSEEDKHVRLLEEVASDLQFWLKPDPDTNSSHIYEFTHLPQFNHKSTDVQKWLSPVQKTNMWQNVNLACWNELSTPKLHFKEISDWLMNNSNTRCSFSGLQAPKPTEIDSNKREFQIDCDKDFDETCRNVSKIPRIQDVCRANELCDNFNDCLCSVNCSMSFQSMDEDYLLPLPEANGKWLLTSSIKENNNKEHSCSTKCEPVQCWLAPSFSSLSISNANLDKWLLSKC